MRQLLLKKANKKTPFKLDKILTKKCYVQYYLAAAYSSSTLFQLITEKKALM